LGETSISACNDSHSSQATFTLGNTPNLNIGFLHQKETPSVIFGSQISLRVDYCERDILHNTAVTKQYTAKWLYISNAVFQIVQNMVKKVTFAGFRGMVALLDPPLHVIDLIDEL